MVTRLRQAQQKNKRKELNGMKLRENVDYRIINGTAFISNRLRDNGYNPDTEEHAEIEKLWRMGYHIKYVPDHFIKTGKKN